jgi:hypothetical protein
MSATAQQEHLEPPRHDRRGGLEARASLEAARRREHRPDAPHLVPAIAAGSRDPVMRDLIPVMVQLYERRHALRSELRSPIGKLLFPAFPELLARPRGGDDFASRRSDGLEAVIRVLLAAAACCNWQTMELRDPTGGYLAVHRLAELAELPAHLVAPREPGDRTRRFRMDTVERALRALRTAKILSFTKQHREQLPDGRYTTTAPALRKLSPHFFTKVGGDLSRTFLWRRGELKKWRKGRADERRKRAPEPGRDLRTAAAIMEAARPSPPLRPPAPPAIVTRSSVPPDLLEAVRAELGEAAAFPDVMREARRRWAELEPPSGRAGAPPPETT